MHRFTVYIKKILKHSKAAKGQRFLRWFLANLMANFDWSYQPTLSVTSSKKYRPHSKCNHQISRLEQGFLHGVTSQNQSDEASMEQKCPWWLHRMQQMVSRPRPKSFKGLVGTCGIGPAVMSIECWKLYYHAQQSISQLLGPGCTLLSLLNFYYTPSKFPM